MQVKESEWYKNLKTSFKVLLKENVDLGFRTTGVAISEALFYKLEEELNYPPDNVLGFKITVIDQSEFESDESEYIVLLGEPLM